MFFVEYCNILGLDLIKIIYERKKNMIKITLKNAQLLEKAKILIDNKVVDKVGISKPTILDIEKGKHILQLKGFSGKALQ